MGYKRSRTLPLTWEPGHELHGLNVRMKRLTVGQMVEIGRLADASGNDREATEDLMRRIADALVSWDLEDDDGPVLLPGGPLEVALKDDAGSEVTGDDGEPVLVPAGNYAVVLATDMPLIMQIQARWMDVAVDVPAPLSQPSSNGAPFRVPLPPMEVLSPNLAS